jgi:hypothetical protein
MRKALILAAALVASAAAQPTVDQKSLWMDTVKRGEMVRQVRGLGEIAGRQAKVKIAENPDRGGPEGPAGCDRFR